MQHALLGYLVCYFSSLIDGWKNMKSITEAWLAGVSWIGSVLKKYNVNGQFVFTHYMNVYAIFYDLISVSYNQKENRDEKY